MSHSDPYAQRCFKSNTPQGFSCIENYEATVKFCAGVPTKHATYQIVLPRIYLHCFKGKFRVRVGVDGRRVGAGMDIKKSLKPHE